MIKNILDLIKISEGYIRYLKQKGIKFNKVGFPLLDKNMFLGEWPKQVVPYDFRNNSIVSDPSKTLLCFYCGDQRIYPRMEKVLQELPEYRRFMGVAGIDITVTSDMDEEWQNATMLLHQLFIAVLAVNGIKIVANLRAGNVRSIKNLDGVPKSVMWAAGFLGCEKDNPLDFRFIKEVMRVCPSKLDVYGSKDSDALEKIRNLGFFYHIYEDYHTLSKKMKRSA